VKPGFEIVTKLASGRSWNRTASREEVILGLVEFVLLESVQGLSEDRETFAVGLLAGKTPIFSLDEVDRYTGSGATSPAAFNPDDPASFQMDEIRVRTGVLPKVVHAHSPPCRLAGIDDRREQHGDNHENKEKGGQSFDKVSSSQVQAEQSHRMTPSSLS
jgi:hypothetical protein